ncbi:efflux RND transporter permease subunit [uncultured Gimesia sp.]
MWHTTNGKTKGGYIDLTTLNTQSWKARCSACDQMRPKMMTVMAILMGLLPIMWSTGSGADVMKRIAAPMVGGVVTSFVLELLIYPAIYAIWESWTDLRDIDHTAEKG